MPRENKPSGGRPVHKSCLIQGEEVEGRWAILKSGQQTTRVAKIGSDGLTTNRNKKVPTEKVVDIQSVDVSPSLPSGPTPGIVGERGTITIPAEMRRRHHLQAGAPYLIEDRGDEIVIQPAEIVPRRSESRETLDGLLARVTAENLHNEVPTGPVVGGEGR
jgi:AbrB family looped-hinge helix DNA binding protein